MKKLFLLSFLALAACAPQRPPMTPEQRQEGRALLNGLIAVIASEEARHCPKHLALNRGPAFEAALAKSREFFKTKEEEANFRKAIADVSAKPGFCEGEREKLLANPGRNPFLRAI